MKFLCVNCSYIFDEALGDESEWIMPGTSIDAIEENIHCPWCDGSFEDFSPIEDEILYVEDAQNLTHLEREHIPNILYQDLQRVEVMIGEEIHPTDDEHRITAIYLVDEEWHIVEEVFIMPDEEPIVEFDISGLENYEIRASCSQHGVWSSGVIEVQ